MKNNQNKNKKPVRKCMFCDGEKGWHICNNCNEDFEIKKGDCHDRWCPECEHFIGH